MENNYKFLQASVESLKEKSDPNLPSQQIETLENDQSPPPSGQEIPSIEKEDSITVNPSLVANRTISVKKEITLKIVQRRHLQVIR